MGLAVAVAVGRPWPPRGALGLLESCAPARRLHWVSYHAVHHLSISTPCA